MQIDIETRNTALQAWQIAKTEADIVIEHERKLRKIAFDLAFPEPKEGTNTIGLGAGWKAKGVYKINYTLDQKRAFEIRQKIALNCGESVSDALLKIKYSLSEAAYKKFIDEKARALIDEILTTKEGLPTLEIVSPKE